MKVRILTCKSYPPSYLKVGGVYDATPSDDGHWLVMSDKRIRLVMFSNEIRFICPGVICGRAE